MTPPDLKALYGARFRITFDEAAEGRTGRNDPWLMQIPCAGKRVMIHLYGENLLAVQCDNRPSIAKRLAELGLRLVQDGDVEKTFVFPVELFEQVAAIVKPRRRRVLSEQQKAVLAHHRSPFLFQKERFSRANLPSISHSDG